MSRLRTGHQATYFLREFARDFGTLNIKDFTKQDFISLTSGILLEGTKTKANRVFTHVKIFFKWCIRQGYIEWNPCDFIKKPFDEQSRERFLSDAEIRYFWQATEYDLEPFGYLYRMLLLTGQRKNECAKMTADEIVEGNHWHLRSERSKNKSQHDIFIPHQALTIVQRNSRSAGPIIFSTTGSGPVNGLSKPTTRLRSKMNQLAGRELEHWQPHDLLRTLETNLAKLKIPQDPIYRVVNHKSGAITKMSRTYNQWEYREEKEAAL